MYYRAERSRLDAEPGHVAVRITSVSSNTGDIRPNAQVCYMPGAFYGQWLC